MGRQRRIHQVVYYELPQDFPDRLERFKESTGLTWNALARRLGVNPYRLREWRKGTSTILDSTNLVILLTLADKPGLRGILMCPDLDRFEMPAKQEGSLGWRPGSYTQPFH